jgi:hypothetical protein
MHIYKGYEISEPEDVNSWGLIARINVLEPASPESKVLKSFRFVIASADGEANAEANAKKYIDSLVDISK